VKLRIVECTRYNRRTYTHKRLTFSLKYWKMQRISLAIVNASKVKNN